MEKYEELANELGKLPWFQAIQVDHLQKITEMSHLKRIKAGEVLFREGTKRIVSI